MFLLYDCLSKYLQNFLFIGKPFFPGMGILINKIILPRIDANTQQKPEKNLTTQIMDNNGCGFLHVNGYS